MRLEFIRILDRWLGLPLCYFFSGCRNLSRIFFLRKQNQRSDRPGKILFIKLSEVGAIILSYPLICRIKQTYPEAQLYFITARRNKELFELLGDIIPQQNILTVDLASFPGFVKDTLRLVGRLFKEKVDIVFDLEMFSRFTALLCFFTLAPKKIGFYRYTFEGLYRGNFYTHRVQYNPLSHVSKSYLSLFFAREGQGKYSPELGQKINDEQIKLPAFFPNEQTKNRIKQRLKDKGLKPASRILLLNPGEGVISIREWPLENFMELTRNLLKDERNFIILVGAEDGQDNARRLAEIDPARCLNFFGQTTLMELLALFYISDALITNDCGLAHLAALSPIKKFIFFGPENPQIFAPLGTRTWIMYSAVACSPCLSAFNHRNSKCQENKCLKAIHLQDVLEMIAREL